MSFLTSAMKSSLPRLSVNPPSPEISSVMSKSVAPVLPFSYLKTTSSSGYVISILSWPFFPFFESPSPSLLLLSKNLENTFFPCSTSSYSIVDKELNPWGLDNILRQSYILCLESGSACFFLLSCCPFRIAQMIRIESIAIWLNLGFRCFFILMASLVKLKAKQDPT